MKAFVLSLLFLLFPGMQQNTPSSDNQLIGSWHGTSICVDHKTDTACRDEEVVYVVTEIPSIRDTVEMEAFKIVNGERLSMGTLPLAYSHDSGAWSFELNTRVHALWAFQVKDSVMTGTLVELPSKRLVRKVEAQRINE